MNLTSGAPTCMLCRSKAFLSTPRQAPKSTIPLPASDSEDEICTKLHELCTRAAMIEKHTHYYRRRDSRKLAKMRWHVTTIRAT
eukprot:6183962-Pleurochrysis_carterae.AAC.1